MKHTYSWIDQWATIPDSTTARANGRTHGVCVTKNNNVIVFHQAENGLLTYDPNGTLISAMGGDRWMGAHGLTLIEENGEEFLWLVDEFSREVVKVTLNGKTVMTIQPPDHPAYAAGKYIPTWAAQNPDNGDVWVGDGYGSSLVHRYDASGHYRSTLTGSTGAGTFASPHGLAFRKTSDGKTELWITDRENHRIQVFDGEENFLRDSKVCHSPCCFSFLDDKVLVPELFTGVKILRNDDFTLITEIGSSDVVGPNTTSAAWWPPTAPEGWPNLAGTEHVRAGMFNSPHGACFAPNGDIYVVEWIIGGRITKLAVSEEFNHPLDKLGTGRFARGRGERGDPSIYKTKMV